MSWPVKIFTPEEKKPQVKWSKFFISSLLVLSLICTAWLLAGRITPLKEKDFSSLFTLLFIMWFFVSSLLLAVRAYFYGVCLSAFETRENEGKSVRQCWAEWASKKISISAYNIFLPSEISQEDIALSHFCKIYKDQKLQLRGYDGEAYTEEQVFYALLSSVRSKLMSLGRECIFDVIFTYGKSSITIATFKDCWREMGFSIECLVGFDYWNGNLEEKFDTLLESEVNRISIIISANIENIEGYLTYATEFASIILVSRQKSLLSKHSTSVALRSMACKKKNVSHAFNHMLAYQSDVISASKLLFSNMSVNSVTEIYQVLRNAFLAVSSDREYEQQHLDLMLGKLGGTHFWLVFALAVFISEKNREPVLLIASVGDDYVFNVIKPSDNSREH